MTTSADQCTLKGYKQATLLDHTTPVFPDAIAWEHMRVDSESISLNPNYATVSELSATRGTTDSARTGANVGGSIASKLTYNDLHQDMLASLCGGSWSTDVLIPGLTRDLWTFQKLILQTDGVTTDYHRYFNTTVGSMSLTIPAEGEVEQTFEIVGGHLDSSFVESPATPTYPVASPVIASAPAIAQENVTIAWGGGLATPLNGMCVTSLTLNIDSGNRQKQCIGELGGEGLLGRLGVSGEASVYFANSTAKTAFLAQTLGTLTITLDDTAASSNQIVIVLGQVKLTAAPVNIEGTGTDMLYGLTFEGHEGGAAQIEITRTAG
jgi:hypothetical protein